MIKAQSMFIFLLIIIAGSALFFYFDLGAKFQKKARYREVVSVNYHYAGMQIGDRSSTSITKTAEGYFLTIGGGSPERFEKFPIDKTDFDALAELVLAMKKPKKKPDHLVMDMTSNFRVDFKKEGKSFSYEYTLGHDLDDRTAQLMSDAHDLMNKLILKSTS